MTRQYTVFNVQPGRWACPSATLGATAARMGDAWRSGEGDCGERADRRARPRRSGLLPRSRGQVVLPEHHQFPTRNGYYQTALHECAHSTGHPDRMNRETLKEGLANGFGSPEYAREELRAEISAMMTGERVGVGHDPQTRRGLCRELGEAARRRSARDSPRCC